MWYTLLVCGCGGIGRHDRFRFYCFGVQVQVLSSAPKRKNDAVSRGLKLRHFCCFIYLSSNFSHFYIYGADGHFVQILFLEKPLFQPAEAISMQRLIWHHSYYNKSMQMKNTRRMLSNFFRVLQFCSCRISLPHRGHCLPECRQHPGFLHSVW